MILKVENIPEILTEFNQWVCWTNFGKLRKVPINPKNGRWAKVNNPDTWGSFENALARYKSRKVKGIGFVFTEEDPFVGIDLDHCIDLDRTVKPYAREIIDRFGSYTEISPSGLGVHILVKSNFSQPGRKLARMEFYSNLRYFTVTGNILRNSAKEIYNRQSEVEDLFNVQNYS